jgi:hypothetical protein
MNKHVRISVAVLAAGSVLATASACSGGDSKADGDKTVNSPVTALAAAYKKTSDVKSAKFTMTMTVPGTGGTMTLSGVQAWAPAAIDATVKGAGLSTETGDANASMRVVLKDKVEYIDMSAMGPEVTKEFDGKTWMKLDLEQLAKQAPDKVSAQQMTSGLDSMDQQDPSQSLALLHDSPNVKDLGKVTVNGVEAEHYKGTLTLEEALKQNDSAGLMTAEERQNLKTAAKKQGIKGYAFDIWVNSDDLPVRMNMTMSTKQGSIKVKADYSDFGAQVNITPPPASKTFDMMEMLKQMQEVQASGAQ